MTHSSEPPASAVAKAKHWLAHDPVAAIANYTWINNVTLGAPYCHFAFDDQDHCLAYHRKLPFPAISVEGSDPAKVAHLIDELLTAVELCPRQTFYSLVPDHIAHVLARATEVLAVQSEWQMVYNADPGHLCSGSARLLRHEDLPAMMALARSAQAMVFNADTFARGEFFGVDCHDDLVAMGGVQTHLPGYCEIGSVVTHPDYRRRGYASQVVAALIQHLHQQGQHVFLVLFQTNHAARALYEKLGFQVTTELKLMHWRSAGA